MITLKGRGLVSPRPLVTYLKLLVWYNQGQMGRWVGPLSLYLRAH